MPCDSVTVRNNRVIFCYRPADRGINRYVTLDAKIRPFHRHFALYLVNDQPQVFGVTVVSNVPVTSPAPEGDYQTIATLWGEKYHKRVVFCKAWSQGEPATEGDINNALARAREQYACESSV
jgi:hypothetical protein